MLCARSGRQRGYFNLAGDVTREAARPPHGSLNRKPVVGSAKEQTAPPQSCATWTVPHTRPRQSTTTITHQSALLCTYGGGILLIILAFNNRLFLCSSLDLILNLFSSHARDDIDYGICNIETMMCIVYFEYRCVKLFNFNRKNNILIYCNYSNKWYFIVI